MSGFRTPVHALMAHDALLPMNTPLDTPPSNLPRSDLYRATPKMRNRNGSTPREAGT